MFQYVTNLHHVCLCCAIMIEHQSTPPFPTMSADFFLNEVCVAKTPSDLYEALRVWLDSYDWRKNSVYSSACICVKLFRELKKNKVWGSLYGGHTDAEMDFIKRLDYHLSMLQPLDSDYNEAHAAVYDALDFIEWIMGECYKSKSVLKAALSEETFDDSVVQLEVPLSFATKS